MLLWFWMANALYETELDETVARTVPMFGAILTMWLIYRLEQMAKEQKKIKSADFESESTVKPTIAHRPNES